MALEEGIIDLEGKPVAGVKGGVRGTSPSLTELVDGEPKMTDFRAVYAATLSGQLGLPTDGLGAIEPVELFGS